MEYQEIRLKRLAKANKNFYIPPERKLAFVVRIKGSVSAWYQYTVASVYLKSNEKTIFQYTYIC